MIKRGDNLRGIAQQVYGDVSYWYWLVDSNNFTPESVLAEGQVITLPNIHSQRYNTAESFKPYNESDVLGDITPQPIAPPPPSKSCNPIAMIVMAVVVSLYTAGAAATLMSGGTSFSTGSLMGPVCRRDGLGCLTTNE